MRKVLHTLHRKKINAFNLCFNLVSLFYFCFSQLYIKYETNEVSFCIDDPNIVDFVITWVNGSDPIWFERMIHDAKEINYPMEEKYTEKRYVQHDEIKWALRSIEYFAPWVNMIHLVTDKQYPNWINRNHPKIHWVNHDTLFYNGFHSYSSDSILFALNNIPNISRRFIYMDDDCIYLNNLTISDFFDNGIRTKTHYGDTKLDKVGDNCVLKSSGSQYHNSKWRAYQTMKNIFNFTRQIYDPHLPIPMDMSLLHQLKSQIDISSFQYAQFRICNSYHFQSIYIQYSYGMNRSILLNNDKTKVVFSPNQLQNLYIAEELPKMLCVNVYDSHYYNIFLPSIFPHKSSFEL